MWFQVTISHGYERSQPITLRRIPKTSGDSGIKPHSKIDLPEPSTLPDVLKTCAKLKAEHVLYQSVWDYSTVSVVGKFNVNHYSIVLIILPHILSTSHYKDLDNHRLKW
jgi:hypothetical protein